MAEPLHHERAVVELLADRRGHVPAVRVAALGAEGRVAVVDRAALVGRRQPVQPHVLAERVEILGVVVAVVRHVDRAALPIAGRGGRFVLVSQDLVHGRGHLGRVLGRDAADVHVGQKVVDAVHGRIHADVAVVRRHLADPGVHVHQVGRDQVGLRGAGEAAGEVVGAGADQQDVLRAAARRRSSCDTRRTGSSGSPPGRAGRS